MFAESNPHFRMLLRFAMLPVCFARAARSPECNRPRWRVARDLLHIFFRLRYFPDNYERCRLWELPRDEWIYYYGSTYHPWARHALRRNVQPYANLELFLDKARCDDHFRRAGIPMAALLGSVEPGDDLAAKLPSFLSRNGWRPLILKPTRGTCGRGIYIAESRNDQLALRGSAGEVPVGELVLDEGYLVQEYVTQHPVVSRVFPHSVNTIRVVVLLTVAGTPLLLGAYLRMGTGQSIVDNVSAGGLAAGVDLESGTVTRYAYDGRGRRLERHPDTGVAFNSVGLPHWKAVLDLSYRAQLAVPFYKLIGLDVAITECGPLVLEINANPDIVGLEQKCGPLLKDPQALAEFDRHELLFNRWQRALAHNSSPGAARAR